MDVHGRLRTLVIVAALFSAAVASQSIVAASSLGLPPSSPAILQGKPPQCGNGVGTMLVGGPLLFGGGNANQPLQDGHFTDAIGSDWVITSVDSAIECPGPPSNIEVLSPVQTTTCGSMELLTFDVTNGSGYNVKDGTTLSLTTTVGWVPSSATTKFGVAYASFLAPSATSGKAEIIVRAGAVIAIKTIEVTCS